MVSEETVREEARGQLKAADLTNTSGRSIRHKVGEALNLSKEELHGFKEIIQVGMTCNMPEQKQCISSHSMTVCTLSI